MVRPWMGITLSSCAWELRFNNYKSNNALCSTSIESNKILAKPIHWHGFTSMSVILNSDSYALVFID